MEYQLRNLGWAKAAWSNLFGPWVMGAAMFIQDARGKFNPIETLEMLHKYPITTRCAPPTAYRMLVLDEPIVYLKSHPPRALRHCVGAGEPLNPEVIKIWEEVTGMTIRDGYGQTEAVLHRVRGYPAQDHFWQDTPRRTPRNGTAEEAGEVK